MSRAERAGGSPTLNDVAREAGVSLATASRVLNGSERKVAESFRERVQRAAAALGYTANVSAQAIARGTAPVIALLVADIADPYFGQIASGVARGADEDGLIVTIAITERDPEREARLLRALRGQRPRGIILAASRAGADVPPPVRAEMDAVAAIGGRIVALGPGAEGVRTIRVDNRAGARGLGEAVARLGYRSAIALAAGEGVRTSDDRVAGFEDGLTAAGGRLAAVHRGSFRRESGYELMARALDDGLEPGTVVFGMSDVVAIGAMSAARDRGHAVGRDFAFCGFDDIPAAHDVTPGLTTVRVPLADVGYRAFRAAVDEDWRDDGELPLEVVVRDSTPALR